MSKTDRELVGKCCDTAERELRQALALYKKSPRNGKELDELKALEGMVQGLEINRISRGQRG